MDEKHPVGNPQPRERVEGQWLVLTYPDRPTIRLDGCLLDRVMAADSYLALDVQDWTVFVDITAGPSAAMMIAESLAQYTRSAPITKPEAHEAAKRRLESAKGQCMDGLPAPLFVGDDPVRASEQILYVGSFACWISDVQMYAARCALVPYPKGHFQASIALLVIDESKRIEDVEELARRIAEYENGR